eukprot:5447922-Pleurochrysis_carterae.AAC.1
MMCTRARRHAAGVPVVAKQTCPKGSRLRSAEQAKYYNRSEAVSTSRNRAFEMRSKAGAGRVACADNAEPNGARRRRKG